MSLSLCSLSLSQNYWKISWYSQSLIRALLFRTTMLHSQFSSKLFSSTSVISINDSDYSKTEKKSFIVIVFGIWKMRSIQSCPGIVFAVRQIWWVHHSAAEQTCMLTFTSSVNLQLLVSLACMVLDLWKGTGISGENPCKTKRKVLSQQNQPSSVINYHNILMAVFFIQ